MGWNFSIRKFIPLNVGKENVGFDIFSVVRTTSESLWSGPSSVEQERLCRPRQASWVGEFALRIFSKDVPCLGNKRW
jgi:hypothetical protein